MPLYPVPQVTTARAKPFDLCQPHGRTNCVSPHHLHLYGGTGHLWPWRPIGIVHYLKHGLCRVPMACWHPGHGEHFSMCQVLLSLLPTRACSQLSACLVFWVKIMTRLVVKALKCNYNEGVPKEIQQSMIVYIYVFIYIYINTTY